MASLGFLCLLISFVMYYVAFCSHVATSFSSSPVFGPKLGLYLVTLQSVCFIKCSSVLLLLFVLAVAVALCPELHESASRYSTRSVCYGDILILILCF